MDLNLNLKRYNHHIYDNNWETGLKKTLANWLINTENIIIDFDKNNQNHMNILKAIFNENATKIWIKAFTHKTWDPNVENNNEVLEHLGDKTLRVVFDQYLINKFPDITEADISELTTSYMSKSYQADFIQKTGLVLFMKIRIDPSIHIKEDLFESIFGALFTVGNLINPGFGLVLCYNLIVSIFNKIDIDFISLVKGNPITQVKNILEKLKWNEEKDDPLISINNSLDFLEFNKCNDTDNTKYNANTNTNTKYNANTDIKCNANKVEIEKIRNIINNINIKTSNKNIIDIISTYSLDQGKHKYTIILPLISISDIEKNLNMDNNKKINLIKDLKTPIEGFGSSKQGARNEAFTRTLAKLNRWGITEEWADKVKNMRMLSDIDNVKLFNTALEKAKLEGYQMIYFPKPLKTQVLSYVQLIGVDKNNKFTVLKTIENETKTKILTLQTIALNSYINDGKDF